MEKIIEDLGAIEEPLGESSMQQLSEVEAKLESARKSFRDLWDIVDAESRTLTAKIKEQVRDLLSSNRCYLLGWLT